MAKKKIKHKKRVVVKNQKKNKHPTKKLIKKSKVSIGVIPISKEPEVKLTKIESLAQKVFVQVIEALADKKKI